MTSIRKQVLKPPAFIDVVDQLQAKRLQFIQGRGALQRALHQMARHRTHGLGQGTRDAFDRLHRGARLTRDRPHG